MRSNFGTRTAGWLIGALTLLLVGCDQSGNSRSSSDSTYRNENPPQAGNRQNPQQPKPIAHASQPQFLRMHDWMGEGEWLLADTHIHSSFSDGKHGIEEIAEQAIGFGCDVIAITDHADWDLLAATPEYRDAIHDARASHPQLTIIAGLEWNVPPYGGDEHLTLLVPEGDDEWDVLIGFKTRFDDYERDEHLVSLADEGLRWLNAQYDGRQSRPLLLLNHPSRKRDSTQTIVEDVLRWREITDLFVGMSGAPGHQRDRPLGSYNQSVQLVDRWDPCVANLGDAWDRLLMQDQDVWAALAPSDMHNMNKSDGPDYWPGQFSGTWIYSRDRSSEAILDEVRSGCFFAEHGHIVRAVQLTVEADGLPRMAYVGEVISVPDNTMITVRLRLEIPELDWQGNINALDEVELICVTESDAQSLVKRTPSESAIVLEHTFQAQTGNICLRARGRRHIEEEPDWMFYTNPIRVVVE